MAGESPPIDPGSVGSVPELANLLRRIRARADDASYRALERWGRDHNTPLPRSTLADVLAGRRLPRKPVLIAYLRACGLNPDALPDWIEAWNRLSEQRIRQDNAGSVSPAPADEPRPRSADQVQRIVDEALAIRAAAERDAALLRDAAQRDVRRIRTEAEQLIRQQQESRRMLSADIESAGLIRIGSGYLSELEWNTLFAGVQKMDIFVAYGQTWRNLHARQLHRIAQRADSRIRVFLPDPADPHTVTVLADRFAITPPELIRRITATRDEFNEMRRPQGADIQVLYRAGDRIFSFYRLDDTAVIGMYSHSHHRTSAVPVFVCRAPGALFEFILEETAVIEQQSRPA